jgi:hypothetical protein
MDNHKTPLIFWNSTNGYVVYFYFFVYKKLTILSYFGILKKKLNPKVIQNSAKF